MLYDCMVPIYRDPTETCDCMADYFGWHAMWIVPAIHANKNLRFSAEIKAKDQHSPSRTPNEGADFFFFINKEWTSLVKFYQSNEWGLICGNLGPFLEGDVIDLRSISRNPPSVCAHVRNFQVCELVGQCPDIVVEGLDLSFCNIYGYIGAVFYSVWQFWEDVGDWFEPLWGIGDEIKSIFYAIGGYFAAASNYMWDLKEWCIMMVDHINDLFDMNVLITYFTDTFAMLTYTASQFVTWLYSSLQEAINFEGLWNWINDADNWFDTKLGGFKDGLEDWIAEKFEAILDKVFKP